MVTEIKKLSPKPTTSWRHYLILWVLGAITSLAFPPLYLIPCAVIGLSSFFYILNQQTHAKTAFLCGWWFGFGHFMSGLYWISWALLVDAEKFAWLIPLAITIIPALLAFYSAITAWLVFLYSGKPSTPRKYLWKILFFASIYTTMEIIRGYVFSGFPWNPLGYLWTISPEMLQLAQITGIWGLSFLTIFTFTIPVLFFCQNAPGKKTILSLCLIPLLSVYLAGFYRLAQAHYEFVPTITLRIVQGNIAQNEKWQDNTRYHTIKKYLNLTKSTGFDDITHVVWPETAIPEFINHLPILETMIAKTAPKNGAIITGALRAEITPLGHIEKMWNALYVITRDGIQQTYDKHHLVPFGEYVPLRSMIPMVEKITHGNIDFSAGPEPTTIKTDHFPPFSPLICYEVIFPGHVTNKTAPAQLMINITNDAWYGMTAGPYQHLNLARIRSVEEGIPLIRAANNGISAVINPYGQIIAKTKLGTTDIIDSPLPKALGKPTIYSQFGNSILYCMLGIAISLAMLKRK